MKKQPKTRSILSQLLTLLLLLALVVPPLSTTFASAMDDAQKVVLSFDANGGDGTMEVTTFNVGEELIFPDCKFTAPTGKIFKAWEIAAGTEYQPGEAVTFSDDILVNAVDPSVNAVDTSVRAGEPSDQAVGITVKAVWTDSKDAEKGLKSGPKRGPVRSGNDVSDILNPTITVTQGTQKIPGDILECDKLVGIKIDFAVPLRGDGLEPPQCVQHGDYAVFTISKDFTLNDPFCPKAGCLINSPLGLII